MRFIDKNTRPVRLCDIEQRRQVPEIAIHGINSFHHHELAASLFARQRFIKREMPVVIFLEFVSRHRGKRRAVAQAKCNRYSRIATSVLRIKPEMVSAHLQIRC